MKPLQQPNVRQITDWIAVGIEAKARLEADDRGEAGEHDEAGLRRRRSLDPGNGGVRDARRLRDVPLAEASIGSSPTKFLGCGCDHRARSAVRPIKRSVSGRHAPDHRQKGSPGAYSPVPGSFDERTGGWGACSGAVVRPVAHPTSQLSSGQAHPALVGSLDVPPDERRQATFAGWIAGRAINGRTERRPMADVADIVIVGGTVVDGTGAPGRPGTVVIDGERLRLTPAAAGTPATPPARSTPRAGSSPRASSTCTATAASSSSTTRGTSPRSARGSRPRWSASTGSASRRSRGARTSTR